MTAFFNPLKGVLLFDKILIPFFRMDNSPFNLFVSNPLFKKENTSGYKEKDD